VETAEYY